MKFIVQALIVQKAEETRDGSEGVSLSEYPRFFLGQKQDGYDRTL